MWNWPCHVTKCKVKQNNRMSERRIWLQNESLAERTRIEQWRNVIRSWEPRICASFLFAFFWNSHTMSSRTLAVKTLTYQRLQRHSSSSSSLHIYLLCLRRGDPFYKIAAIYNFYRLLLYERKFVWRLKVLACHALHLNCLLISRTDLCPKKGIILIK